MSGPRKKPNSGKHVFLKNSSSGTDQRLLDADFDRYWDDESKNNNRNRIRVGRQYQATVPPLLKPGETDGRKCEDLETLKWKPDQEITDEQLDNYLSVVKAVSLFAKAINICQNPDSETGKCLQNALRGLSEFVRSHHPKESKSGCQVSPPGGDQSSSASGGSPPPLQNQCASPGKDLPEGNLFLRTLEVCGKNFANVKKDLALWKPIKNLIDYYCCVQKGQGAQQQKLSTGGSNGHKQQNCDLQQQQATLSSRPLQAKPLSTSQAKEVIRDEATKGDTVVPVTVSPDSVTAVSFPKPVSTSLVPPPSENRDTVGSLKFYLDGQMVLKLNARQGSSGTRGQGQHCQWVQSKDKCLRAPRVVRRKRRKRRVNGDSCHGSTDRRSTCSGSDSDAPAGDSTIKRKMLVPCVTTVLSPKPAWTPPVEKDFKCPDSSLCEDTSLHGS